MKVNAKGIRLIQLFEGCKLQAYQCSAKKWTIGWGNTYFEDRTPVKQGDKITQLRADSLLKFILDEFAIMVRKELKKELNQNQFSALVSFTYNVGVGNLKSSTLLKKVNINPNDPTIKNEFAKWNKAGGQILAGLSRRREAESKLYFDEVLV